MVPQTSTWVPMTTVRSAGSPKYSAGLAALCASVTNSNLRHGSCPGAGVARIEARERK